MLERRQGRDGDSRIWLAMNVDENLEKKHLTNLTL
jgi:hypothetical protein